MKLTWEEFIREQTARKAAEEEQHREREKEKVRQRFSDLFQIVPSEITIDEYDNCLVVLGDEGSVDQWKIHLFYEDVLVNYVYGFTDGKISERFETTDNASYNRMRLGVTMETTRRRFYQEHQPS